MIKAYCLWLGDLSGNYEVYYKKKKWSNEKYMLVWKRNEMKESILNDV